MIVIGLLATIAYAVFIGQRTKAKDAEAKDNVASLAVQVESCRVQDEDFTKCDTKTELEELSIPIDDAAGLATGCSTAPTVPPPVPPGASKVAVMASDTDCYVAIGQTDDGHFFWLWHKPDGTRERHCTPAGQGSCIADSSLPPTIGSWN